MSDDVLDQLQRENPIPERMPPLPIEPVLARLDTEPAVAAQSHAGQPGQRRLRRARPLALTLMVVLVVAGVVGVVLTLGGHNHAADTPTITPPPAARTATNRQTQTTRSTVNPTRIARENARDTPTQLFESQSLRSTGPTHSKGPGSPMVPYAETVIPSTVRELGTLSLAGVGTVQYWTADTKQHGVCAGLRLPDGVWMGLQKHPTTGSMPGCWPTREQTSGGALIIDGFDYVTSGVIGHQGQRWLLAYGAVSTPETVTRVRDAHSGIDAAIVSENRFAIALHPVGNDWGDDVHLEAFNAAGQRVATEGKPLPRSTLGLKQPTRHPAKSSHRDQNPIIQDCFSNGHLTHAYSTAHLRDAVAAMPASVKKYTNCQQVIGQALSQSK